MNSKKAKKFQSPEPRNEKELIWYAVDLDDTLAKNSGFPYFVLGEPVWENVHKAINVYHAGYKLVIHTSRHWSDYEAIENWLDNYQIPFKQIICGKPMVKRYIDDKGINASEPTWLK